MSIRHFVLLLLFACGYSIARAEEPLAVPAKDAVHSFEELQARIAVENTSQKPEEPSLDLIEQWVDSRGLEQLTIDELQWCLQQSLPSEQGRKEFSVTWTGLLTPPHDGEYTFSVSPINVNAPSRERVRHSITASVAGTQVLETLHADAAEQPDEKTPSRAGRQLSVVPQWKPAGDAISLQAGKAVPITVKMSYSCAEIAARNAPSAILFWEGPGINRQVVPSKVLSGTDGKPDLRVEYRWPFGTEERLIAQEDENIDFVVSSSAAIAPRNPEFIKQLSDRIFELATSKAYLDQCATGKIEHIYCQDESATNGLTSNQREQFLKVLASRPKLLTAMKNEQLVRLYQQFRFGAEEQALDIAGLWMQVHADIAPEITIDFFKENRQPYWELGQLIGGQLPEHVKLLQDRYLVLEDGRCVLPVAYTLSYATLVGDRMQPPEIDPKQEPISAYRDWVELLTEELNNDSLTGNLRVNWLLAKAQASEAQATISQGEGRVRENYLSGLDSIIEARVDAEDAPVLTRLWLEEIARLATMNQERRVAEGLEAAADAVASQTISIWRNKTNLIAKARKDRLQADKLNRKEAYVTTIERRRERAARQNDEESVKRYDQILQQAGIRRN